MVPNTAEFGAISGFSRIVQYGAAAICVPCNPKNPKSTGVSATRTTRPDGTTVTPGFRKSTNYSS